MKLFYRAPSNESHLGCDIVPNQAKIDSGLGTGADLSATLMTASPQQRPMAVVVAHPDDEALWLSSVVTAADRVIFCFGAPFGKPQVAAARRKAVAVLPLAQLVDLGIPESGARFSADWAHPRLTPSGIAVIDTAASHRYTANYPKLIDALRKLLAGFSAVYTHNPWGEYGHAEHIQVHHAVAELREELGYAIWFSNYVGARSWPLALKLGHQTFWEQRISLQPDRDTARRLMRVYRRRAVWTWNRTHRWPDRETVYALSPANSSTTRNSMLGEWLLDVAGLRWWPPPLRSANRRLG